jgi:collagen type VI alpha
VFLGYDCKCIDGYEDVSAQKNLPPGHVCKSKCEDQKTDLIFVVDSSGSIGQENFDNIMKPFIKKFAGLFTVGSNATQIGLIQFSTGVQEEFKLNQYNDTNSVLAAIDRIRCLAERTA